MLDLEKIKAEMLLGLNMGLGEGYRHLVDCIVRALAEIEAEQRDGT